MAKLIKLNLGSKQPDDLQPPNKVKRVSVNNKQDLEIEKIRALVIGLESNIQTARGFADFQNGAGNSFNMYKLDYESLEDIQRNSFQEVEDTGEKALERSASTVRKLVEREALGFGKQIVSSAFDFQVFKTRSVTEETRLSNMSQGINDVISVTGSFILASTAGFVAVGTRIVDQFFKTIKQQEALRQENEEIEIRNASIGSIRKNGGR